MFLLFEKSFTKVEKKCPAQAEKAPEFPWNTFKGMQEESKHCQKFQVIHKRLYWQAPTGTRSTGFDGSHHQNRWEFFNCWWKCWTECMRTVTTLDDLTTELRKLGCILSHSTIHSCSLPQVIKKAFKVRWVEKNVDNWKIEENIRFGDIKFTETKSVAFFLKFCKLPYFFNFSGTSFCFI